MPIPDIVRALLEKRGVTDPVEIEKFLNPNWERDTHDPFLLHDMEQAVSRLLSAISRGERIAIYADFDCDGIPGAALLSTFLKKIGYENFTVYIPHRDREGYGFHKAAVDKLSSENVSLIITVDVGMSAVETARYAKDLPAGRHGRGVDVIVTDHHEHINGLPDAVAVINPKLGEYPCKDLCGAAVAWKLAQATIREGRKRNDVAFVTLPEGWEKWLLDLVAIATVADMVPLVDENRVLTHFGLKVLRKSPRRGLRALCSILRLRQSELSEDDIGFSIAPRVNAASRMDEPELAFHLLTTENEDEAARLAQKLERLNTSRKGVVGAVVREAKRKMRARFTSEERVIVIGNTEWKPALLGLAANSVLCERSGVVCLWGRDANGVIKGSCRSDGSISITELFANAHEVLTEYGGHKASGGFSVSNEHIHTLHESLARAASGITQNAVEEKSGWDIVVSLSECTEKLFGELLHLAPFGIGNSKPVLRISGGRVTSVRRFGKSQEHTEVILICDNTGYQMRCFQFFAAPESFSVTPKVGEAATALATLERDSYRNTLALRVTDIVDI